MCHVYAIVWLSSPAACSVFSPKFIFCLSSWNWVGQIQQNLPNDIGVGRMADSAIIAVEPEDGASTNLRV
jgi:hypothetical protein